MTAVIFAPPSQDPEAHEPVTSVHVAVAEDIATVAAAEAQLRWGQVQQGFEVNAEDLTGRMVAFQAALAQSLYAWAVYHSAKADSAAHAA